MMRAAGVPSRVVAGCLGGEPNPYGGYLIVRQSDAHAWVEVWLEDKEWTRIDPTAVVAPERTEGGAEAALAPNERIARPPYANLTALGPVLEAYIRLRYGGAAATRIDRNF